MGYTIYNKTHKNGSDLQYRYQLCAVAGAYGAQRKSESVNRYTTEHWNIGGWEDHQIHSGFAMLLVVMYAPFNNQRINWIDLYNRQGYAWTNNTRWNIERCMTSHKDIEQRNYNRMQLGFIFIDSNYANV